MSNFVCIGIDGTTPAKFDNVRFETFDLNFSFIWNIVQKSPAVSKIHIPGPNLGGEGTSMCVGQALAFVRENVLKKVPSPKIFLCGYSRGAYAALRVAQGLGLKGIAVDYLGLFDIVKCTDSSTEDRIGQNELFFAGRSSGATPESLYRQANPGSGANWNSYGAGAFNIPENVVSGFHFRRNSWVNSRTTPMGTYPINDKNKVIKESFYDATHSAMGGMPFRGDYPESRLHPGKCSVTRVTEWTESRKMALLVEKYLAKNDLGKFTHATIPHAAPPLHWYTNDNIQSVYESDYFPQWGLDGTGLDPAFEKKLVEAANRRADRIMRK